MNTADGRAQRREGEEPEHGEPDSTSNNDQPLTANTSESRITRS